MVLLAAAVCNKAGKAIISRQFVEMSRARIEGLLAAFPKLMNTTKQHTFVETESVRYVYQPLEKLYVLLITTKASNILEDLETLRLFARVVPEYCRNLEETDIAEQAFQLIFAFDEIVALGYRENVNLAQIRTFIEMDSHEEKVYLAMRETQEREARENMQKKARELTQARREAQKRGVKNPYSGIGSSSSALKSSMGSETTVTSSVVPDSRPSYTPPTRPSGPSKALKLGSKTKDVDSFVDQLKSEGEAVVASSAGPQKSAIAKATVPAADKESVQIRIEEKITCVAGRDGGLQNLEVLGFVYLHITDEKFGQIKLAVANNDTRGIQLQTHPNVDKKLFQTDGTIALKVPSKPFPIKQDVGILKWRLQSTDESLMPLTINCWPNPSGNSCDVNIEYELHGPELNDVVITIPVPSGVGAPVVGSCDGDYRHDSRKNVLEWTLPVIDESNSSGSMEFSILGRESDFFPVVVSFASKRSYSDIKVTSVQMYDDGKPVKFSQEVVFYPEKYEIV